MASFEDIQHQRSLLEIHRRNVRHYQSQLRRLRDATPVGTFTSIKEERDAISRIQQILMGWGEASPSSIEDEIDEWERELGVEE